MEKKDGSAATKKAGSTVSASESSESSEPNDLRLGRTPGIMRIAIPSKGSMSDETKQLFQEIGADVILSNPRQYTAVLRDIPNLEVWLQRPSDIVRKLVEGDIDLGITGGDLVAEYGDQYNDVTHHKQQSNLIVVHEDLGFGKCRLGFGVPIAWTHIHNVDDLLAHYAKSETPLRVATKFTRQSFLFFESRKFTNYKFVVMDGALEASTQMGTADCIIDLISSGVTLRENLLKEIEGGTLLKSTMQLLVNRQAIKSNPALLATTRELVERIDAHTVGKTKYNVIANIRGGSPGEVARKLSIGSAELMGMDGPTISTVIPASSETTGMYAIGIIVSKDRLYNAVQKLRSIGGSGVCVLPVTYVFERECERWQKVEEEMKN